MDNYLEQLCNLVANSGEPVPLFITGDLFHKWNSPPELINFAMTRFPKRTYAIPGQHDLSYHNYEDIRKSAYWTLVEGGVIHDLCGGTNHEFEFGDVWAFPFGHDLTPAHNPSQRVKLNIALIHHYVWKAGDCYPDAPKEGNVSNIRKKLAGFDVIFAGDNHRGFLSEKKGEATICNCGTFIRRNSDEINYKPAVGLLYSDGSVRRHLLDTSEDRIIKTAKEPELNTLDAKELIKLLQNVDVDSLDFKENLRQHLNSNVKMTRGCKKVIFAILEELK